MIYIYRRIVIPSFGIISSTVQLLDLVIFPLIYTLPAGIIDNWRGISLQHWRSCHIAGDDRSWSCNVTGDNWGSIWFDNRSNNILHIMGTAVHHRLTLMGDRWGYTLDHSTHISQYGLLDNCCSWRWIDYRGFIKMTGTSNSYGKKSKQHHLEKWRFSS